MNCNIEKKQNNKITKLNQLDKNINNKFQKIQSKDYFKSTEMYNINNQNKLYCNNSVYVNNDARLVNSVYGNIMPLDKIPEKGYTDISKIYDNNYKKPKAQKNIHHSLKS